MINQAWKAYVEEKYPDNNFSDSEIARIYLQEQKGISISNKRKKKLTQGDNCPGCGRIMTSFPLCGSCDLSKEGHRSISICPASKGLLQKVNTDGEPALKGDKAYKDYFTLSNIKTEKIICNQLGILSTEVLS